MRKTIISVIMLALIAITSSCLSAYIYAKGIYFDKFECDLIQEQRSACYRGCQLMSIKDPEYRMCANKCEQTFYVSGDSESCNYCDGFDSCVLSVENSVVGSLQSWTNYSLICESLGFEKWDDDYWNPMCCTKIDEYYGYCASLENAIVFGPDNLSDVYRDQKYNLEIEGPNGTMRLCPGGVMCD